jgi:hypothetical protein
LDLKPNTATSRSQANGTWLGTSSSLALPLPTNPSPHTRIDVAPLAGIGHDSPYLETFLIFSIDFGTGETKELEEPASSRFHR